MIATICRIHACSSDWLLGLPERGAPAATAAGAGAVAIGSANNSTVTTGGDCSKCKLMKAHLRAITGRKSAKMI